ncbi:NPC intracellular cholesterol transporter 1 [Eumeta japonica]|uniref:NPC intracellular cholesterol transporter 1 n=1 Tax=Eumeta variegata TaxID=151549 RepID=A0A4C1U8L0_EUMVA|nr:NPC intracellular cholesterol transporter 1 [Eumeta japonica]
MCVNNENTFKAYYYSALSDEEDTMDPNKIGTHKRTSKSINEFFESTHKKGKAKTSSTVGQAVNGGISYLSTNGDDFITASHLIKIEVYELQKLKKIPPTELWKHADIQHLARQVFPENSKFVQDAYKDATYSVSESFDVFQPIDVSLGLFSVGGLDLLKWSSNSQELLNSPPETHLATRPVGKRACVPPEYSWSILPIDTGALMNSSRKIAPSSSDGGTSGPMEREGDSRMEVARRSRARRRGRCVWYGICKNDGSKKLNCLYDGPPKPIQNDALMTFRGRESDFKITLDDVFIFDIAHAATIEKMKIEEDKVFLRKQRKPGRPGCLGGVDKKLADKEERARQRRLEEEERIKILNSELRLPEDPCSEKASKRGEKTRTETIKTEFQNNLPDRITVHWDGKLLPGLDVRSLKEERLPIIAIFDDGEQLLTVPKPESSSGKHQAKAVSTALFDWSYHDKVQIMCCDTTASNIGRFNGACAILEQTFKKELLLFTCRHYIYDTDPPANRDGLLEPRARTATHNKTRRRPVVATRRKLKYYRRPLLEKYCPDVAAGGVSCCDKAQLDQINSNIGLAESLLSRCPVCMENFVKHVCGMTCHPNQKQFLFPKKISDYKMCREEQTTRLPGVRNINKMMFTISSAGPGIEWSGCSGRHVTRGAKKPNAKDNF